jgi:hypothetical protein
MYQFSESALPALDYNSTIIGALELSGEEMGARRSIAGD